MRRLRVVAYQGASPRLSPPLHVVLHAVFPTSPFLRGMEELGLIYLSRYRVLLCKEHGYCLPPKRYRRHLWELHAVKGDIVKQVVEEVQELDLVDPVAVATPACNEAAIPYLTVTPFVRCILSDCVRGATACSQRAETVRKHQSKDHGVGVRKSVKPSGPTTEEICMQSFFPSPFARWFQVQMPSPPSSRPRAQGQGPSDCMQDWWSTTLAASQASWQAQFDGFRTDSEIHQSQTPPWLTSTGIGAFLEGLGCDKSELAELRVLPATTGEVWRLHAVSEA